MLKELYLLWLRLAAPQDLHYINGADTLPPPLPPEQERAALDALTRGQPQARDLLITHNLRLVVYIAKKFETPTAGHRGHDFHRHYRAYQGGQHIRADEKHQAGNLRQPMY